MDDEQKAARKAHRKLERKNERKRLREAEEAGGASEQVEAHVTFEEPVVVAAQPRPKQKGTSGSTKVKKNTFIPITMDSSAINLTRETIDDDDDVELVLIQVPSSMEPQAALCNHGLGEKLREILLSMSSSSSNSGGIISSTKTRSSHFELLSAPLRIEAASTADGSLASQIRVVVQRESAPSEAGAGDEWEAALTSNAELVTKRATKMISVLHDIPELKTTSSGGGSSTSVLGSVVLQKRGVVPQFTHLGGRAKRTKAVS
jgi:hypothetical protein